MSITTAHTLKLDLQRLMDAFASNADPDSPVHPFTLEHWGVLSTYLQVMDLSDGQVLFQCGHVDRTIYLLESGRLSVHNQDSKDRLRMVMVGPGSLVGEASFFAHQPRKSTVQAAGPARVWLLTALRFSELSNRQPAVALSVAMAFGATLGKRLLNSKRRIAAT